MICFKWKGTREEVKSITERGWPRQTLVQKQRRLPSQALCWMQEEKSSNVLNIDFQIPKALCCMNGASTHHLLCCMWSLMPFTKKSTINNNNGSSPRTTVPYRLKRYIPLHQNDIFYEWKESFNKKSCWIFSMHLITFFKHLTQNKFKIVIWPPKDKYWPLHKERFFSNRAIIKSHKAFLGIQAKRHPRYLEDLLYHGWKSQLRLPSQ